MMVKHLWDEWMMKLYNDGAAPDMVAAMRVVFNR